MPNQRQPELPVDPESASADEDYRDKCFEDLSLCADNVEQLVDNVPREAERDAGLRDVVELYANLLRCAVKRWREAS